jgi:hypothetical protein
MPLPAQGWAYSPHQEHVNLVLQGVEAPPAAPSLSLGERTRGDFPILHQEVNGKPLVYLDNAATSQKPQVGRPNALAVLLLLAAAAALSAVGEECWYHRGRGAILSLAHTEPLSSPLST